MHKYLNEPIPNIFLIVKQSRTVPEVIKRFFYSIVPQIKPQKKVTPFIPVGGVYILSTQKDILSDKLADITAGAYNQQDCEKYFNEYITGFKYGYFHFEKEVLAART